MVAQEISKRLIRTLTQAADEDELLSELGTELLRDSGAETVDILLGDNSESLILRASTISPEFVHRLKLGKGIGLCGQVMATGKPLFVTEGAAKEPRYASYPGIEGREGDAFAIYPLTGESGEPVGVVEFGRSSKWPMPPKLRRELGERVDLASQLLLAYRAAYQSGTHVNRLGAL